jgi:molybdopterin converting factor small subunit
MPTLKIPTPLRAYVDGQNEINVQGDTVAQVLESMIDRYPALSPHLFNGQGELRPFVNLFLGEENVRDLDGLDTPVGEQDRLRIIPSIAGGVFE